MTESLETELLKIASFIKDFEIPDSIPAMEDALTLAIGHRQRTGEVLNDVELVYAKKREESLAKLHDMDEETETSRRAKLDSWTADEMHQVKQVKNLNSNLKSIQMLLFSAIKSRREER